MATIETSDVESTTSTLVSCQGGTGGVKGAYVELIASTSSDAEYVTLMTGYGGAAQRDSFLVYIAIGGTGVESDICAIAVPGYNGWATPNHAPIPLSIPSGSRVSVAVDPRSAGAYSIGIALYLSNATYLGEATANETSGVCILQDPGGSTNSKSSPWDELIASTSENWDYIVVTVGQDGNAASTDKWQLLDIGIGASGFETVLIPDIQCGSNTGENVVGVYTFHVPVSSGSRIVCRSQATVGGTDADRLIDVSIAGFTVTAPSGGTLALAGAITTSSTVAGAAGITASLAGAISTASTVAGDADASTVALAGSIASSSTVAGETKSNATLASAIATSSATAGDAGTKETLASAIATSSAVAGDVTTTEDLAGAIATSSATAGDLTIVGSGTLALAGDITTSSTTAGGAVITASLAGAITTSSATAGDAQARSYVAGASSTSSTVAGEATITSSLAGASSTNSTAAGEATITASLGGAVTTSSVTDAELLEVGGSLPLAGAITTSSATSGNAGTTEAIAGTATTASTVAGNALLCYLLSGAITTSSTQAGALSLTWTLSGMPIGRSTTAGNLISRVTESLGGAIASTTTLVGNLTGPFGPIAGDGFYQVDLSDGESDTFTGDFQRETEATSAFGATTA